MFNKKVSVMFYFKKFIVYKLKKKLITHKKGELWINKMEKTF